MKYINARQLCINNQGVVVVKNKNKQIKNIKYIEQNFGPGTHGDIESHPSLKHQNIPKWC